MDIRSIESAMLIGEIRAKQWRESFEASFYAPVAKRMMRLLLQQMPREQMDMMSMIHPEQVENAKKFSGIGGV